MHDHPYLIFAAAFLFLGAVITVLMCREFKRQSTADEELRRISHAMREARRKMERWEDER